MTTRRIFLGGVAATLVASASRANAALPIVKGEELTQAELFASLPVPRSRQWTRLVMGSGAFYQKQIGLGSEVAADGSTRLFYELQVGTAGGSCNPNTLRKAYLRSDRYGSLLETYRSFRISAAQRISSFVTGTSRAALRQRGATRA